MLARNRTGATPSHDDILAEYARLGIRPISGGDGTDDAAATAAAEAKAAEGKADAEAKAKADADETAKLGDAGKKALDAEREARSAADKAAKEAQKELAAFRKEKADREDAERKAAEAKAKQDGEWQKLADEREAALSTITGERDALTKTVESLEAYLAPILKKDLDALKAKAPKVAEKFPKDAPILDQIAWMDDDRTRELLSAQDAHTDALRRVPGTPKPNANPSRENEQASRARAARAYTG